MGRGRRLDSLAHKVADEDGEGEGRLVLAAPLSDEGGAIWRAALAEAGLRIEQFRGQHFIGGRGSAVTTQALGAEDGFAYGTAQLILFVGVHGAIGTDRAPSYA